MSSNIDPKIFSKDILSDEDHLCIKQWIKDNFIPNSLPNAFWNSYAKQEWRKQQERHELSEKMKRLDRESRNF